MLNANIETIILKMIIKGNGSEVFTVYRLEEEIGTIHNEMEMLNDLISTMKNNYRKVQNEYDSLSKTHERSKELILSLEAEKSRLEHELNRFIDKSKTTIFTNEALLAKDKALQQLSQLETSNITKLNKFDMRSEFIQTTLCDINNIVICQRPSEANKPLKPCK